MTLVKQLENTAGLEMTHVQELHTSAAISLKRIADVAELFAMSLLTDHAKKDADMADWAKRHGFSDLWPGKSTK